MPAGRELGVLHWLCVLLIVGQGVLCWPCALLVVHPARSVRYPSTCTFPEPSKHKGLVRLSTHEVEWYANHLTLSSDEESFPKVG